MCICHIYYQRHCGAGQEVVIFGWRAANFQLSAQNFNFVFKFSQSRSFLNPNLAFLDANLLTKRKFSDSAKLCSAITSCHDALLFL